MAVPTGKSWKGIKRIKPLIDGHGVKIIINRI